MEGPSRVLITGASGFVGRHLAARLCNEGCRVHAIARPSSDLKAFERLAPSCKVHIHDGDDGQMAEILEAVQPQVIFHLASLFLADHRTADLGPLVESNLLFGTQLVDAAAALGIKNVVNTGTSWQYGRDGDYDPVCLYAATKDAFESILGYFVALRRLNVISLLLYDTYGPQDPRPKLMAFLQKTAASAEPLAMSPGMQQLELVYIDDVVDAYLVAARRLLAHPDGYLNEKYPVCAPTRLSLREVVRIFGEATGTELPIEWGGRPYREREVMEPWHSEDRLPGWQPKVTLFDGIQRMLDANDRWATGI